MTMHICAKFWRYLRRQVFHSIYTLRVYSLISNSVKTYFLRGTMMTSGGSHSKASAYNAGDLGSIPGSGRSPREGNGNPLQYSCLENPMDGGTW